LQLKIELLGKYVYNIMTIAGTQNNSDTY